MANETAVEFGDPGPHREACDSHSSGWSGQFTG